LLRGVYTRATSARNDNYWRIAMTKNYKFKKRARPVEACLLLNFSIIFLIFTVPFASDIFL